MQQEPHVSPPPDGPYKRRKCINSEPGIFSGQGDNESTKEPFQTNDTCDSAETLEATIYRDVFIMLRFSDHDLPFKLKDIIMSKLRLLTLLEAGLPSWVIFLQSYPGFCRLYRPWMCPLARALYVLISVVTVLIGFYDLYKNVPLLKETLSNLFGPLFEWIEAWEMISRIKYLGTMLFLHNCQKAIKWFLMLTRTIVSFLSFSIKPILHPLNEFLHCFFPLWSMFMQIAENYISLIWMVFESSFTVIGDIMEILLLPIWYILVVAWNIGKLTGYLETNFFFMFLLFCDLLKFVFHIVFDAATSFIYPLVWVLLYGPFRLLHGICRFLSLSYTFVYDFGGDLWLFLRSFFRFAKEVDSTVSSYEVSMWRSLWDDLFSQVIL